MAKALITGIAGSGGSYLADYILEAQPKVEVHGIARWHTSNTTVPHNLKGNISKIKVHECDLMDFSSVFRVMREVKPDYVFHLAAHANVRASFTTPLSVVENNVMGTLNLLEAIRLAEIDPKIQICSTSEVYGQVDPSMVPIKEDCPLRPASPYAVSKVTQDLLGFSYFTSYKMKIVRTRMFAYLNPRRADLFATAFAMQVARIEKGLQKELKHGNLDSTRTFIDVRDAMESYWVAAEKCIPGEAYNIGGTTTKTVGEFLEILKSKAKAPISSGVDPALLRPSDVTLQIPDTSKFEKATGWKAKYSFEESVENLLAHCRAAV
jgi:GDP-4-dehydro-6-deoxy-D-mannose reductase